ncbi:MAG: aminopeptidase P family protein [Rhodobiaceae bacterium]|nr:aminopeptidase P family protein [Rhodobiaceae bacterium]
MFQTFESRADPTKGAGRVARLLAELAERGLDGFIVPHADEHQSEYLPPHTERLHWLTGFSGSAGAAVVLAGKAAIFVDGRYTLQVRDQVDSAVFEYRHLITEPPAQWLEDEAPKGSRIGYDPWLHTLNEAERLEKACEKAGADLVAVESNPLDAIWDDRPPAPQAAASLHPAEFAGKDRSDKIAEISKVIADAGCDAAVLTACESIAWLFNLRGADIAHTPLVLANAVVRAEGRPQLFVEGAKLSNAVRAELAEATEIEPPAAFSDALAGLSGRKVGVDPALTPYAVILALEAAGATIVKTTDPVQMPRAIKNATEIEGARSAHHRDAVPMARFLAWLDREAPGGAVGEIAAAKKLEALRAETGALEEISFDTISGAGPNGAIVHYRVSEATNRTLEPGALYLVDSGAQYRDGTTDITRTVTVGTPSAGMIRHFTLVLKGHIALATIRFPEGTSGAQLDVLARTALWKAGLDYDHGTGHGVGSFLGVHEGPQRISKAGTAVLKPGMMLSNEPGYYKTGEYGIRIENLLLVTEPEEIVGGERAMLGFETLTFTPIDRRLVDPALLTDEELDWLNAYHGEVAACLAGRLDDRDAAWLAEATAPIRR